MQYATKFCKSANITYDWRTFLLQLFSNARFLALIKYSWDVQSTAVHTLWGNLSHRYTHNLEWPNATRFLRTALCRLSALRYYLHTKINGSYSHISLRFTDWALYRCNSTWKWMKVTTVLRKNRCNGTLWYRQIKSNQPQRWKARCCVQWS